MAEAYFTEMDFALLRCLAGVQAEHPDGVLAAELTPLLEREFPQSDEVAMRQGETITRLRGKDLVEVDTEGRIRLTDEGARVAAGE
jgi:hypothetical protein